MNYPIELRIGAAVLAIILCIISLFIGAMKRQETKGRQENESTAEAETTPLSVFEPGGLFDHKRPSINMQKKPKAMTADEAKWILGDWIRDDGSIRSVGFRIEWKPGDDAAQIDCTLTADELEAIAWWMRNEGEKQP